VQDLIESAHLALFLSGVFVISLSGALMPGPVTAAAVAKGQDSGNAGIWVSLRHGAVEIPLVIAIALGLSALFQNPVWNLAIGVVGGLALLWMGLGMIRDRRALGAGEKSMPMGSFQAGAVTTASNPYFFIWWATLGALLITRSLAWGPVGVVLMAAVHWSVDLAWNWTLSLASRRGREAMTPRARSALYAACGVVLVAFGAYFALDGSGVLRLLGERVT
jgi:threonine/homoserine/homoserine lactone efflux protein